MVRLGFLLTLALAACTASEFVREYHGYLPGTNRSTTCIFLVRDTRTGKPIEGAVVRQHEEWSLTEDGRWAPLVAERVSDEHGLVCFDTPEDGSFHFAFHAEGYAPTEEYGGRGMNIAVDLGPGAKQAGRLLGPWGKPLAGVEVEYKTGCAHAPALAVTRTDEDGVFVFNNVGDGDITFEDPRVQADYLGRETRPPGWGMTDFRTLPGGVIRGLLARTDGKPLGRAVVHSDTSPRGPRVVADRDGTFVLEGVDLSAKLHVHWEKAVTTVDPRDYRPGGPLLIRLPPEDDDDEVAAATVTVELETARREPPAGTCYVFLDRISDGRRFRAEWVPDAPAEFEVPPGKYDVSVGEPSSRYVASPRRVYVRGPTNVTVGVREQPRLVGVSEQQQDAITRARILVSDRSWEVAFSDEDFLPADSPAWLRVDIGDETYTFPIGPSDDAPTFQSRKRQVRVNIPGLKRIVFTDLDLDYEARLLFANDVSSPFDDTEPLEVETYAVGRQWVLVTHATRGRAVCEVELPWKAARIEVRDLAFDRREKRELRLLDENGIPIAERSAAVFDAPYPTMGPLWADPDGPDSEGRYSYPGLRAGMHVRTWDHAHDDWRHFRLKGEPPYEVRFGTAAIELDVGHLPEPSALLGGWAWRKADDSGRILIRGLEPGTHDVIVGATDRVGLVYRLRLKAGETRRIRPELRPRAPQKK